MSVAIVTMVNHTAVSFSHQQSTENNSGIVEFACLLPEDSVSNQTEASQVSLTEKDGFSNWSRQRSNMCETSLVSLGAQFRYLISFFKNTM